MLPCLTRALYQMMGAQHSAPPKPAATPRHGAALSPDTLTVMAQKPEQGGCVPVPAPAGHVTSVSCIRWHRLTVLVGLVNIVRQP